MNRARILLADDHDEMRDQIKRLLENEFEVLDSLENGLALLEAAAKITAPTFVCWISRCLFSTVSKRHTRLRQGGSTAKIVFLTIHEDLDFWRQLSKWVPQVTSSSGAWSWTCEPQSSRHWRDASSFLTA